MRRRLPLSRLTPLADGKAIRRVRVGKEDVSAVTLKDRHTGQPYKAVTPGENHHIDIVQMRDGTWKGFAATVFEVNRPRLASAVGARETRRQAGDAAA